MRIDKFICDTGLLGRRDARQYIRDGRVSVNGAAAPSCDAKIDPEHDRVEVDGAPLSYSRFHYYVMNKPAGILTATEDKRQKTVLDLLPPELRRQGVFPVGRLDKDTTGLLLLTDDGDFAHRVISPKSEIKRCTGPMWTGSPPAPTSTP
jgi:16S rRNA pseudouridine516 synthase